MKFKGASPALIEAVLAGMRKMIIEAASQPKKAQ